MSKRENELYLFDIFIAIVKIQEYIKEKRNAGELLYDCKSCDAVIRELEIIGEAVKKLIQNGVFTEAKRKIVNFRNIIINQYFGIDQDIVWDVIVNMLPQLKKAIIEEILKLPNKNATIDLFIEDNRYYSPIIDALKSLKN